MHDIRDAHDWLVYATPPSLGAQASFWPRMAVASSVFELTFSRWWGKRFSVTSLGSMKLFFNPTPACFQKVSSHNIFHHLKLNEMLVLSQWILLWAVACKPALGCVSVSSPTPAQRDQFLRLSSAHFWGWRRAWRKNLPDAAVGIESLSFKELPCHGACLQFQNQQFHLNCPYYFAHLLHLFSTCLSKSVTLNIVCFAI